MTTSTKLSGAALAPRPPSKGSFPLDHLSECKEFAIAYERCLNENRKVTNKCRKEAREYLECRMERGLMAKEEWRKLGLGQIDSNMERDSKSNRDEADAGDGDSSKGDLESGRRRLNKNAVDKGG